MSYTPLRTPLSMQTEQAKQQQLFTFGMLFLVLGPLTTAVAGVLALLAGRSPKRMGWCALFGVIGLGVGGWGWATFRDHALLAQAWGRDLFTALQQRRSGGELLAQAQELWPLLWWWWRADLLLAPLTALNILSNRVRSAEEQERERLRTQQQADAAQARLARAAVAKAPISSGGNLVLGVPIGVGDLPWQHGGYLTYPTESLARHGAVIGSSGVGKSETVLRLADGARRTYGWKVFFVDCKDAGGGCRTGRAVPCPSARRVAGRPDCPAQSPARGGRLFRALLSRYDQDAAQPGAGCPRWAAAFQCRTP
jgi:hypothetical protein